MTMNEMIDDLIDEEQKSISDYERLKCVRALDTFELYCITRHNRVLLCLKELQAHRAAWEKAKRTVKAYLMLEEFGSEYQDDIEKLIDECRPKEGENE